MKYFSAKKICAGILGAAMLTSALPSAVMTGSAESESNVIFSADFEDGVNEFTARGEDETLTISNAQAHSGDYSLCVSTRAQNWNGPKIALDDIINVGEEYLVTAYAKTAWYSTITLSMQYTDTDDVTHYTNILAKNCDGSSWNAYENIKFSFPAGSTDISLYFEASDASVDIYMDDFSISEAPYVMPEDIPGLKDVYAGYFKMGTAITASNLSSKSFMALVEKHFDGSITPGNELKPDHVLNEAASLAMYEESGDDTNPQVSLASAAPILEYCQKNNIPMRGHTLVWHSQTPDWFFKEGYSKDGAWVSEEKMIKRMENYIKNVMEAIATNYPDLNMYAWDVVNEAFTDNGSPRSAGSTTTSNENSPWVQVFGDNGFIEYAFTFARKYAPAGCKLYYNDFNEYIDGKTNAMCKMAAELKEKNLIDGIGMQAHLDVNFPSATQFEKALAKFAETGLDIQVTELDATTSDTSEAGIKKQAQYYSDIMDAIVKYKDYVDAVVFWGVTDDTSWRGDRLPLLFDADYKAKPAYYSIIDGIDYIEPTTKPTTEPTTVKPTNPDILWGDANCDDKILIDDVVLVMSYAANPDGTNISAQGLINSDVYQSGDGVQASDAASIQKYLTKVISALPES